MWWEILSAPVFFFLFPYLVGDFLLGKSKFKKTWDFSLIVGLSTLVLFLFFSRWIFPYWLVVGGLSLFSIWLFIRKVPWSKFNLKKIDVNLIGDWIWNSLKNNWVQILVCLSSVLVLSHSFIADFLAGSKIIALSAYTSHDQTWHLSLINELTKNFPPEVPGYEGMILYNYHYFMDLLMAFHKTVLRAHELWLFQIVYPFFWSILYAMAGYRVLEVFTKNKFWQNLGVILIIWGSNLSMWSKIVGEVKPRSDLFLYDQSFIFMFNQQTVWSIALVLYSAIILHYWLNKKNNIYLTIVLSILWASMVYAKIYSWVVFSAMIGIVLGGEFVYKLVRNKLDRIYWKKRIQLGLIGGGMSLLIILSSFHFGDDPFIHIDLGWVINIFVGRTLAQANLNDYIRWKTFYGYPLSFKGIIVFGYTLLIFLFFNYGIRVLGLLALLKKKNIKLDWILFLLMVVSLSVPMIGFQNRIAFNIVQFAPYGTVIIGLLFIRILSNINRYKFIISGFAIAAVIFTSSLTINKLIDFEWNPKHLENYDANFIDILTTLRNFKDGTVLLLVSDDEKMDKRDASDHIMKNLVGAIGDKQSYLSGIGQMFVLNIDDSKRQDVVKRLMYNECKSDDQFRIVSDIKYIVTFVDWDNNRCLPSNWGEVRELASNEKYKILEVRNSYH